jgi:prepilin peptidase CpaA
MNNPLYLAAIMITAIACVTDLRDRRIPNWLTFGAAAVALLVHAWIAGAAGVQTSVGGWLLGVALFLPFFALRGLGGGDVKLLGAIGAWLGPSTVLYVAFHSAIAGGVLAIVVAVRAGYLRTAITNIGVLVMCWWTTGLRPVDRFTLGNETVPKLAYAIPMFAGLVVTLWLR